MKYSEWDKLTTEQRDNAAWHKHPHIRTATLFSLVFIVGAIVIILGIGKNSVVHLNRQPDKKQAFQMACMLVKEKLKQPQAAVFTAGDFKTAIDTSHNLYQVQSTVKLEDTAGKLNPVTWIVKMYYTGGDWADRNSWKSVSVVLNR